MKVRSVIIVAILGVVAYVVFWLNDKQATLPRRIVLISIDTIRADHMSCYGYRHKTSPAIDTLAEEAILFEHCFSPIPLTLPSHSSMLTGVIPPTHGVHDNLNMALADSVLTLPEILQEKGFATYGIVSAGVLNNYYGLNQGFDVYDDEFESESATEMMVPQRFAEETATRAMNWIEQNQDKKAFLFVHFYDPHDPYDPPPPYDKKFPSPYDGEIAYTDYWIGRILDKLKELNLYEDALIIITGDHAEMLGEHNEAAHGYFIYHNVLQVPLIVKPAGKAKSHRVADNTALIDIAPTLLSQCDLAIPGEMQGINLSNYFVGGDAPNRDRVIFSESLTATKYNGNALLSVIYDQWHYIQTTRPELYNHLADPGELHDLIGLEAKRARFLQGKLDELLEAAVRADRENPVARNQVLETLGYVGGSVDADFTFDQSKPDPKDMLSLHQEVLQIMLFAFEEKFEQAIQLSRNIVKKHPDIAEVYRLLSVVYMKLESYDEAIETIQRQLALQPDEVNALKLLFEAHFAKADYSQAMETINLLLEQDPRDIATQLNHARVHLRQGSYKQAVDLLNRQRAVEPENSNILSFLAEAYFLSEDYPRAIETLQAILDDDSESVDALQNLGEVYFKQERFDQAIKVLKRGLAAEADAVDTLGPLVRSCNKAGNYADAIQYAESLITLDPNDAEVYYQLGIAYHHLKDQPKTLANCLKAVERDGKHVKARISAAETFEVLGKLNQAVYHYKIALEQDPNQPFQHNQVAWIQATSRDPDLHDPPSALVHAKKAVELALDRDSPAHEYYPHMLDTLSAVLAANGQFDAAIETAMRALKLCEQRGLTSTAKGIRAHLTYYRQNKSLAE